MSHLQLSDLKTILYPERHADSASVTETRGNGASQITRYRDKQENGDIVWRIKKKYNLSIDRLQQAETDILYKITTKLGEVDEESQGRVSTLAGFNPKEGFINLDWYGFDLEDWQRLCSAADKHNHAQWCDAVFLLRLLRAALLALRGIHRLGIVHCDIRRDNLCLSGEEPFEKGGKTWIRLDPDSLVLIDFGIAVENGDSSRLSGIVFLNGYWKSEKLRDAHKKLQRLTRGRYLRQNQYPEFFHEMDYFALGSSIEHYLERLTGEKDGGDYLIGDDAHIRCLRGILQEMPREKSGHGQSSIWLKRIKKVLTEEDKGKTWELSLEDDPTLASLQSSWGETMVNRPDSPRRLKRIGILAAGLFTVISIIGVVVATLPRAEYEYRSPPVVPDTLPSPTQCSNGKAGYLRAGQEVFCRFDETTPFAANRLAGVRDGDKWGWVDADGKEVIAPRYRAAGPFSADGFAAVQAQDDIWFLIDRNGARAAPDPLQLIPGGCRNGNRGYFYGDWELYCAFDETSAFAPNRLASARKSGKWGWIDARGETVIPFRYQEVIEDFGSEDGRAMVRRQETRKWIDRQGRETDAP